MRSRSSAGLVGVLVLFGAASTAIACLWDYDTLQMERKRFPAAHELMVGKFVRHSRAYYEWRVQDRLRKLEDSPGEPALVDDLAVAYDKLGRQAEGIEILEECLASHPRRYETLANLGTLYIHAGQLDKGAELIEQAIQVNPDAHFGREKYQLLLVRYVQRGNLAKDGVLSLDDRWNHQHVVGFSTFALGLKEDQTYHVDEHKLDGAIKGVLGIMHFGNYESPVVLEVLGDLLLRSGQGTDDARLLAARCYLLAWIPIRGNRLKVFGENR